VKHYPGLVLSDDASDIVFGELVRLHRPDESFATLDEYEGCGPGVASPQYLRQLLPVTRDDGTVSEAWTYVYNLPGGKAEADRVGGGFWSGRLRSSMLAMPTYER